MGSVQKLSHTVMEKSPYSPGILTKCGFVRKIHELDDCYIFGILFEVSGATPNDEGLSVPWNRALIVLMMCTPSELGLFFHHGSSHQKKNIFTIWIINKKKTYSPSGKLHAGRGFMFQVSSTKAQRDAVKTLRNPF